MRTLPLTMIAAAVTAALTAGCSSSSSSAPQEPFGTAQFAGHWASEQCEQVQGPTGTSYIRREGDFTETTGTITVHGFGDAACSVALFTAKIDATYALGATVEEGVRELDVTFVGLSMTANDPSMVKVFTDTKCGTTAWVVGTAQDISGTGCLLWRPKAACGQDFDVAKIVGTKLFLGVRSADMCTRDKRATVVSSSALVRK